MSTIWYDPIATLGFLAAATKHVRLMSYVWIPAYRHPLVTAKAFLTLDALSGGRVVLGCGAGHLEAEFATLGVPFAERGKRMDEALDVIVKAFLDEYPSHDGPTWTIHDVGLRPRPVQQPRPPIWIGGNTPAALRRAAAKGDGWIPQGTFRDQFPAQVATIREHRRKLRGDEPIEIAANSPWLYLGKPAFEMPPGSVTGAASAIAESAPGAPDDGRRHVRRPLPLALVRRAVRSDRGVRARGRAAAGRVNRWSYSRAKSRSSRASDPASAKRWHTRSRAKARTSSSPHGRRRCSRRSPSESRSAGRSRSACRRTSRSPRIASGWWSRP
jgi:probable F420-dependent oxidoreductase